jgi:ketosteroid isomerase-like protein
MRSTDILKAAFDRMIGAFSARDLELLMSFMHENVVFLGVLTPVPVQGTTALRTFVQNFFGAYTVTQFTPLDPHVQVTESIGLVWGSILVEVQSKRIERRIFYFRYSCTFGNFASEWRLLSMHTSWMPQTG